MATISVIGTGYLGTTHAACLAELGFDVIGLDTDPERVGALGSGRVPFYEPDLAELVMRHTRSGRLRFTTDPSEVAGVAIHFLCVGTPQRADGPAADTRQVFAALASVLPHLTGDTLVVGKSTVPVGTASRLQALADWTAPPGVVVEVAWNPEFLREGHAVADTLRPERLVFGVGSEAAEKQLREVYRTAIDRDTPCLVTDLASAEIVKTAANAFLATKLSFINAIADLCEVAGGDVDAVARAMGLDPRIGPEYLGAGIGFGGGCLPKDVRGLAARADELGVVRLGALLEVVDGVNRDRRQRVVDIAVAELGRGLADDLPGSVPADDLRGRAVAVLGAAFKPFTDDVRDSPALDIAQRLRRLGATVRVFDPVARENARRATPELEHVDTIEHALAGADLVLHLTDWPQFAEADPRRLARLVSGRVAVDGRHTLDTSRWREAGWRIRTLGRPAETAGINRLAASGDGRDRPEGRRRDPRRERAALEATGGGSTLSP